MTLEERQGRMTRDISAQGKTLGIDRRSKNRRFPKTEDSIFFLPIVPKPKTEDRRPKSDDYG